ncbi:MAG: hypothetical protein UH239_06015 [Acutalibacteraceae bacterium]|nr:hypothetical protein [Acutalibacteraceae bacterium]
MTKDFNANGKKACGYEGFQRQIAVDYITLQNGKINYNKRVLELKEIIITVIFVQKSTCLCDFSLPEIA